MSLTSQLADRHSPLREYFERYLPDLKGVRQRWRDEAEPYILPSVAKPPWAGLGAAFDYRFRYFFAITPPDQLIAAFGARHLAATMNAGNFAPVALALGELLREQPTGRLLDGNDERLLCGLCYVLGLYEAVVRHPRVAETTPLIEIPPDGDLDCHLALVDNAWVDDLVALGHGFMSSPAAEMCDGRRVVSGPVPAGSIDVGGADADLIVGTTLLEVKTTKLASPPREWIYQLLGYVLLDEDDSFRVDHMGFYLPRSSALLTWRRDELFAQVAGGPVKLAELRRKLRASLSQPSYVDSLVQHLTGG